ncbi:MAG: anaerobic sulfatase-maturation protein [Bacteroidales bacterium]|nr:anaerobic sulfatase-maturation protein [Bacteroidales bacterium]
MLSFDQPVAFHIMAKPIGPVCNLDCTYCYYLEKDKIYNQTMNFRMPDDVLEFYTRQYIESQDIPELSFTWQGGEPTLLGLDFFKKAIALQDKYKGGKKISNSFQTNGTLLNDEWCRFFKENNFLVGISIDGPKEIHDRYRVDKQGRPTFDRVLHGIELLKKHNVDFNTLTVVPKENARHPLDVYNFLKRIGSGFIQFIPIVERERKNAKEEDILLVGPEIKDAEMTEWSVNPEEYGEFLITVFDEWVRKDVGRVFVQIFDVTLVNWVGQPGGLCVFSETCGNALVLEHNGDLYCCDHFVYPHYFLGNIRFRTLKEMALSAQQYTFGQSKLLDLPGFCMDCEYRFACHGECPKHRFTKTPGGEEGLNYLCKGYKKFFSYVHPYMQYMGDELIAKRPPANVMKFARQYKRYTGN